MSDPSRAASDGTRPIRALSDTLLSARAPVPQTRLIRGREAVAALHPLAAELCRRTGQTGALDALDLLIQAPMALTKTPCLVLAGLRVGISPESASPADLKGMVLLYEYRVFGLPTRIFATDDTTGERTVIAPPAMRVEVALEALRLLDRRGARITLISVERGPQNEAADPAAWAYTLPVRLATRTRTKLRDLPLCEDLDATLACLGKNTRRNFRRYRTRVEEDFGHTFLPEVQIGLLEFLTLNQNSTNPVSTEQAAWRYRFLASPAQPMFAGLRTGDGRWLSLIAGSRHGDVTHVEWQVNRADLPQYSLSTVMRSYLIEHEIARGTRTLVFKGGTPHSMGNSFLPIATLDLIALPRSLAGRLLLRFARWIFPRWNFLGGALKDPALVWHS